MNLYEKSASTRVKVDGVKAVGQKKLLDFLSGQKQTPLASIRAKCYDCMCYYQDGKVDCGMKDCPLYPYMPYREEK